LSRGSRELFAETAAPSSDFFVESLRVEAAARLVERRR